VGEAVRGVGECVGDGVGLDVHKSQVAGQF
jgi:hypothetical protein